MIIFFYLILYSTSLLDKMVKILSHGFLSMYISLKLHFRTCGTGSLWIRNYWFFFCTKSKIYKANKVHWKIHYWIIRYRWFRIWNSLSPLCAKFQFSRSNLPQTRHTIEFELVEALFPIVRKGILIQLNF